VTTGGWQGDQGGGWNPPDPYGQPQYGPAYDPYGQYQQDPYGQTAYQPYPGFGEPPPPKKSKLPIILSLITIVAIVGGVVAIVLLNRDDDPQPAANTGPITTSSGKPATPTRPPTTSRRPPSSGAAPAPKTDWATIQCADGSCSYQVPPDWKKTAEKKDSGLAGLEFGDGAEVGTYECGGAPYFRGFSASNVVQSKTGAELDVTKVVSDFANSFANKYYANPKIDVPDPVATTVGGKKAATVTAGLTVQPTKPECEATVGEVAVVGVALEQNGKVAGVRVLVVVNDLEGGPADPKPLPDPLADQILETLTVK
jgi:hypothetical protein